MKIGRYKDIEAFLFKQLPMYQRVGARAFKKDLKNIKNLAAQLDQPQEAFRSIHIAGTNGKGSVSFYIAAALHAMGYKVGLYTSPHYKDYRERIKVDGKMIPKVYVKKFVNRLIAQDVFKQGLKPSFFEITVAMAFQYFKDEAVDYAVIETGLGGRLDSTNIITPILSVITNIGFDHTNFLGNTLPAIANEKAGIIKSGVPVVIGRRQTETKAVFKQRATKMKASISYVSHTKNVEFLEDIVNGLPAYQKENLNTALAAIQKLDLPITQEIATKAWKKDLKLWAYMGRYQLLSRRPNIICDSAHNKMGLTQLFQQIESEKFKHLHIVIAMVGDKDLTEVLPLFPPSASYYISQAKIPRAKDRKVLHAELAKYNLNGKIYTTIPRALAAAKQKAGKGDLILVTGSIFTVAEVV